MSATSAVLTGLSLATGIAREAADGVPIVKQVLGVASRIVGLAEQIEKNREDLHALAERAKNMDATIAAIVGDRELGPVMIRRMEAMNGVLRDIEKRFASHIKRGRVSKSLSSIFTVRKEVERLKGEFDDRLKELEVAANIDTNVIAWGDSRFIGEFRNIRHCEINLLKRPLYVTRSQAGPTNRNYIATCEGSNEVFVVRYTAVYGRDEYKRQHIEGCESILERMSLLQYRHPVIAYLYGKNQGPRDSRFVVPKVGDIRAAADGLRKESTDVALVGRIAARLMDACCHLQKHGAVWESHGVIDDLFIDQHYEPRIGVVNDIVSLSPMERPPAYLITLVLTDLFHRSCAPMHTRENQDPCAELRSTIWTVQLFSNLIDAGYHTACLRNIVRPADITSVIPFSHESRTYLQQADDRSSAILPSWGVMLTGLASGTKKREGHILHATYHAHRVYGDRLEVHCVDDDVDVVYHSETYFAIPRSAAAKVRQQLGIEADDSGNGFEYERFDLARFAGPGEIVPMCTGWTQGSWRWSPWWCAIRRYRPECHRKQYDWDSPAGVQLADIQSGRDAE